MYEPALTYLSRISLTSFMASSERGLIIHSKGLGPLVWCREMVNILRSVDRWLHENIPNGSTFELRFWHSGIPIIVQDRSNVEYRQHASDDEVHRPES